MKQRRVGRKKILESWPSGITALIGVVVLATGAFTLRAVGDIGGGDGFELTRQTIDGGGVMRTAGDGFELSGTIGQPDAGVLAGGGFELAGGFWFPVAAGDHDEDGVVSLDDYSAFEACMTGPDDGGVPQDGCESFDVNHSGAIDLADFAVVQTTFTGQ